MNHPMIMEIMRTGYPMGYGEPEHAGVDSLGNEILVGDEIMILDDEVFVKEELSHDAVVILELFGAVYEIAE